MSGRPEGEGVDDYEPEPYDQTAWQEFTPWRPGDASTAGEGPASYAAGDLPDDGRRRAPVGEHQDGAGVSRSAAAQSGTERSGRWWTEDVPRRYEGGERVRSIENVGGEFISHVPRGTEGRVVSTRTTWSGEERLTVEFSNGYREEDVKPTEVRRDSWY